MARVIPTPTGGGPVGTFEPKVLETLRANLPDTYLVAPNFQLKQQAHSALEYDFVVIAPHALFVVEAKEWYGRLTGDDTEWLINGFAYQFRPRGLSGGALSNWSDLCSHARKRRSRSRLDAPSTIVAGLRQEDGMTETDTDVDGWRVAAILPPPSCDA
jgi:hypothetical protein